MALAILLRASSREALFEVRYSCRNVHSHCAGTSPECPRTAARHAGTLHKDQVQWLLGSREAELAIQSQARRSGQRDVPAQGALTHRQVASQRIRVCRGTRRVDQERPRPARRFGSARA